MYANEYKLSTCSLGGDKTATTGPAQGSVDDVCARALIHHLKDLDAFLDDAHRILTSGGS
ncbi:methyltransferase domain-containing protein [Alicyclobacillus kakegawensis]|uniref:methyltransferase domain-containing protein n=1 Tax=Alicyclobacillus kakegawensis TaxID=392012 RepID=UPI0009FB0AF2